MVVHVISIQGLWSWDLLKISGEFILPLSCLSSIQAVLETGCGSFAELRIMTDWLAKKKIVREKCIGMDLQLAMEVHIAWLYKWGIVHLLLAPSSVNLDIWCTCDGVVRACSSLQIWGVSEHLHACVLPHSEGRLHSHLGHKSESTWSTNSWTSPNNTLERETRVWLTAESLL